MVDNARLAVTLDDKKLEAMVRSRVTEILASAGVGYNVLSQALLYLLPEDFRQQYEALYEIALKDGVGVPGEALARTGELGKAPSHTSALRGKRTSVSSGGKRYKKFFVIADEDALSLKNKMDKRLRMMAREIRAEIDSDFGRKSGEEGRESGLGGVEGKRRRIRCETCGRTMASDWNRCPYDGRKVGRGNREEASGESG